MSKKDAWETGSYVTVDIGQHLTASNVFEVSGYLTDGRVLLAHPLTEGVYLAKNPEELDVVGVQLKNKMEHLFTLAHKHKSLLDYDYKADLEALSLYFMKNKQLSGKQKKLLSNICGNIAAVTLDNDIEQAIDLINKNKGLLDSFNNMWYDKFKDIFEGRESVKFFKQRLAVFNMAGFVMAELEN